MMHIGGDVRVYTHRRIEAALLQSRCAFSIARESKAVIRIGLAMERGITGRKSDQELRHMPAMTTEGASEKARAATVCTCHDIFFIVTASLSSSLLSSTNFSTLRTTYTLRRCTLLVTQQLTAIETTRHDASPHDVPTGVLAAPVLGHEMGCPKDRQGKSGATIMVAKPFTDHPFAQFETLGDGVIIGNPSEVNSEGGIICKPLFISSPRNDQRADNTHQTTASARPPRSHQTSLNSPASGLTLRPTTSSPNARLAGASPPQASASS